MIETAAVHPRLSRTMRVTLVEPDFKRRRSPEWDFRGVAASTGVCGIHPYPAMFHFGVVRELLSRYSREGDLVLDPFVGSGVVAVQCLVSKRNCIGYDINPLAILVAKVRTTPIAKERLLAAFESAFTAFKVAEPEVVVFRNIDFWFEKGVIRDLSRLRRAITACRSMAVRRFLEVTFSETVRRVSNTRYNEFKLFRRAEKNGKTDVMEVFGEVCRRNMEHIGRIARVSGASRVDVSVRNVLQGIPLENRAVDLVITSPPYGDSRTTVAYGQFSRLSLQWLGMEENVDRTSLGSSPYPIERGLPSDLLYVVLRDLSRKDVKRAREVYAFYRDLFLCVQHIAATVRRGGRICFVVGNRRVKGQELPTDAISADFFDSVGFTHEETIVRAISNKRMPSENSPTNVSGAKDSTMRFEYIVIMRKR
jgi:site-specific DNA-methyltransferase (cytosine-N4-specific)